MLGSLYCNLMMSMHAVSDADDISCCLLEPPQKKRAVALASRQSPCDRRQTRSTLPGLDLSKCFFCQKRARKKANASARSWFAAPGSARCLPWSMRLVFDKTSEYCLRLSMQTFTPRTCSITPPVTKNSRAPSSWISLQESSWKKKIALERMLIKIFSYSGGSDRTVLLRTKTLFGNFRIFAMSLPKFWKKKAFQERSISLTC